MVNSGKQKHLQHGSKLVMILMVQPPVMRLVSVSLSRMERRSLLVVAQMIALEVMPPCTHLSAEWVDWVRLAQISMVKPTITQGLFRYPVIGLSPLGGSNDGSGSNSGMFDLSAEWIQSVGTSGSDINGEAAGDFSVGSVSLSSDGKTALLVLFLMMAVVLILAMFESIG